MSRKVAPARSCRKIITILTYVGGSASLRVIVIDLYI